MPTAVDVGRAGPSPGGGDPIQESDATVASGALAGASQRISNLGEGVLITAGEPSWLDAPIVYVNEAMCAITGYDKAELIGRSPRLFHRENTDCETLERIDAELSAGLSSTARLSNRRKDGNRYDAELGITALCDAEGRRTHFVSSFRDITRRKDVLQRLRTSEERFRKIFELAGIGIAIGDRDGRFEQCNPAFRELLGYSDEEYREIGFASLVHPDDREANVQQYQRLLSSERSSFEMEHRYVHKDGHPVWVHKIVSTLHDPDGNPSHFVSLVTNMTERRAAEEAVREREKRLRTILDTALDAIIAIDGRGNITAANPATERMFGYTRDELVGRNFEILLPPLKCDVLDEYVVRDLQGGGSRIAGSARESVGARRDGSTFPVSVAVSEADHRQLFTAIIRDISQLRELQKQVLEIAADEDRRIGAELHDNVQQQLTGLGLLARSLADELEQRAVPETGLAARLAAGISETARQVHLLSRGLVPVEVDAQGLQSALTDLASTIDKGYGLTCEFQSDPEFEVADNFVATHLYRIAQEAVNNAIRHGKCDWIRISLTEDRDTISLVIRDNGVGMGRLRDVGPGMGLRIMEYRAGLLGGDIQFEPSDGCGTVLKCTVPKGGVSATEP